MRTEEEKLSEASIEAKFDEFIKTPINTGIYQDGRAIGFREKMERMLDEFSKEIIQSKNMSYQEATLLVKKAIVHISDEYPKLFDTKGIPEQEFLDIQRVSEYLENASQIYFYLSKNIILNKPQRPEKRLTRN